jgi:hypothetical protein
VSLLQESQHELEEALSHLERIPSSPVHLQDPPQWLAPSLPVVRERFGTLSGFEGLSTPLEILAACSMSSERLRGKDQDAGAAARDVYYGPNLNSSYQDADPALDPVNVGLLTEADFDRLLALYYAHLRPFFFHLDPRIHTAAYLRAASPFLSTAICATAAKFCPLASGILQQLTDHAVTLSLRVVSNGFKSVSLVPSPLTSPTLRTRDRSRLCTRSVSCNIGQVRRRVGVETRAGLGSVAPCTYLVSRSSLRNVLI